MIIYTTICLLIQFLQCKNTYYGTIPVDQALSLSLNYTAEVESVIVKFYMESSPQFACVVSPVSLSDLQLSISDLSLSQRKSLLYDYQGFTSQSKFQLVQIEYSSIMNLKCLSFNTTKNISLDFELYYSSNEIVGSCVNDCNGYNYPEVTDSVCVEKECHCLSGKFGMFCQFQSKSISSNSPAVYSLDPGVWIYLQYQFKSNVMKFQSNNSQNLTISFSFVLKQTPQYLIPSLSDGHKMITSVDIQQFLLEKQSNSYVDVMYIGLVNLEKGPVEVSFQVVTDDDQSEDEMERNKIIIIVTGCVVGSLLLFAFLLSVLKSRQQKQFQIQIQEAIRRNLDQVEGIDQPQQNRSPTRQVDKANMKGFPLRFIQDHFKGHQYDKIIKVYPGLAQFEDCVVCLESMKNGVTKLQKTCSVTPCFHMFHHRCLEEWLLRQKNCPFCRTEHTRKKIIKEFPWLEVNTLRVNNTDSTYLSRMKNQPEVVNESQMNLVPIIKEVEE